MVTDADLIKYGFEKNGKADHEESEEFRGSWIKTGFPKPARRYRMHYEGYNISIEEPYFWTLHYLRYYGGFSRIDKITDVFAAAENSAFFGANQQKIGLQQDKVSQFLATIGKMVRELFQLVREMRILDERISYYSDSFTMSPSAESAEITLKGIFVDLVEQGAKNPASVYGMAREVQFTTLPDLFFSTHPMRQEDVDETVERERGQFNRKVREVLKRKLRAFLAWKEHSYEEIKNRRKFTLKYLRQHFEIIRMYMTWVKPYLRNIKRLQFDQSKAETPDLIAAFESSMIEVEILAVRPAGPINQCILMHYLFRTRPEMNYMQEGYQRGPIHLGRIEIDFRAYAWTDKEIENYKRMRDQEDFQLLGVIDGSVKAAMEALGDELMRYLKEAGEEFEEKKEPIKPVYSSSPFVSVFKGFAELFTSFKGNKKVKKLNKKPTQTQIFHGALAKQKAEQQVKKKMWETYHHFKKQHGMLNW
tara:strand:- start:10191 stop:11618 length:1428 start_codon:yes stop_codon:yes gene_type:complete